MTITQKIPPVIQVLVGAVLVGLLLVLVKWGAPVLTPVMVAGFLAALAAQSISGCRSGVSIAPGH